MPAIGGKDSMSGSFKDLHEPPTLVSFAVQVGQADQVVSACLTRPGQTVWLLPVPLTAAGLPEPRTFMANLALVRRLASAGRLAAAATVKQAGAACACAQMCFGNRLGFEFDPSRLTELFQPGIAGLLLALADEAADSSDGDGERLAQAGAWPIGRTLAEPVFKAGPGTLSLTDALDAWQKTLEKVFPTRADLDGTPPVLQPASQAARPVPAHSNARVARPRVFIPVFPGTNCEYDTAKAFRRAGGEPDILVVRNLTPAAIQETMDEMVRRIARAQIIMLPGGFSGGDEPEGSGKFIAAAFHNPAVAEQVRLLLKQRDGLMLGICNGFQALIKLGLLPGGDITELTPDSPTLTFNRIGRHASCYVTTRIVANHSPWLRLTQPGDLHRIPISHGEGRFAANPAVISQLADRNQIATQYVDLTGLPSYQTAFNPNASVAAIEGITSPDGRIFGKMGHSERQGPLLARNIPGEKDQRIFQAGVSYFT